MARGRWPAEPVRPEVWRDIPGHEGVIQASSWGRIRKLGRCGGILTPYDRKTNRGRKNKLLLVRFTDGDGNRIERSVSRLVAMAFGLDVAGKVVIHRNSLHADCSIRNLAVVPREKLPVLYGVNANRRPVVKIDRAGEIVACYPSERAAAKANYLSNAAIQTICAGGIKDEWARDGYSYRWDDDG